MLTATSATADKRPPGGYVFANDTSATTNFFAPPGNLTPLAPQSIGTAGGTLPHDNMQPFLVMNYCIALNGVFPSRN
jgi:microcystin-dependent protein